MNQPGPWQAFYASELQSVWLLLVAPLAFLAWRAFARGRGDGVAPALAPFVSAWGTTTGALAV